MVVANHLHAGVERVDEDVASAWKRWVGGWMEEKKAVGMRCWTLREGGWRKRRRFERATVRP